MKRTLAIARRELKAYFATAIGWLVLCGFVFLTGLIFALILTDLSMQPAMNPYGGSVSVNEHLLPGFFGTTSGTKTGWPCWASTSARWASWR